MPIMDSVNVRMRFRKYVDKSNGLDECWIWTGAKVDGYGVFLIRGEPKKTHRLAYDYYVGEIPDGLQVLHKCDVRNCVNPKHLFLGTNTDNIHDAMAKGRRHDTSGSGNPYSILTEIDVLKIRELLDKGFSGISVAARFGVHPTTISDIKRRRRWIHI